MLKRAELLQRLTGRFWDITEDNGFPFSVKSVWQNPKIAPSADDMPIVNVYEYPDKVDAARQSATVPPKYKRSMQVATEIWYPYAKDEGAVSGDISTFAEACMVAIFRDGTTLGGLALEVGLQKYSKVYRDEGSNIGLGMVYTVTYQEDVTDLINTYRQNGGTL